MDREREYENKRSQKKKKKKNFPGLCRDGNAPSAVCDARCLNYTRDLAGGSFLFIKREGAENWRRFESQRNEQKYYGFGEAGELAETGREAWWVHFLSRGIDFLFFILNIFFPTRFGTRFGRAMRFSQLGSVS